MTPYPEASILALRISKTWTVSGSEDVTQPVRILIF